MARLRGLASRQMRSTASSKFLPMIRVCIVTDELYPFTAGGIGRLAHNLIVRSLEHRREVAQFHLLVPRLVAASIAGEVEASTSRRACGSPGRVQGPDGGRTTGRPSARPRPARRRLHRHPLPLPQSLDIALALMRLVERGPDLRLDRVRRLPRSGVLHAPGEAARVHVRPDRDRRSPALDPRPAPALRAALALATGGGARGPRAEGAARCRSGDRPPRADRRVQPRPLRLRSHLARPRHGRVPARLDGADRSHRPARGSSLERPPLRVEAPTVQATGSCSSARRRSLMLAQPSEFTGRAMLACQAHG